MGCKVVWLTRLELKYLGFGLRWRGGSDVEVAAGEVRAVTEAELDKVGGEVEIEWVIGEGDDVDVLEGVGEVGWMVFRGGVCAAWKRGNRVWVGF
jgi:hypothetical protein